MVRHKRSGTWLASDTQIGIEEFSIPVPIGGFTIAIVGSEPDGFAIDNLSYTILSAGSSAALSKVRAVQRTGTDLVDVYYDLSGVTASVFVSASVSTNSGASYTLQPANITGDGVTTAVGSGSNYHLIWNAGLDLPNTLSRTMRIQLSIPGGGNFAQAVSPIFTLDTRNVATGALTGRVLGNGSPLANAQVRVKNKPFATSTLGDGTFTLPNIPAANGYVVDVSAADYTLVQLTGVNVPSGTENVGDIPLTGTGGPYHLIRISPDVNPSITTIEQGGTAYRYYCVVNSTNGPQGGIAVLVQAGGTAIPQTNDISSIWPGEVAGVSFGDGIGTVCVCIPSSVLGAVGTVQTLQSAWGIKSNRHYHSKRRLSRANTIRCGGINWVRGLMFHCRFPGVSIGGNVSAESEVRHNIVGLTTNNESISRIDSDEITVSIGAGFDVGASLQASSVSFNHSGGFSAGAGLFGGPVPEIYIFICRPEFI